ncbi:MAG: ASCH domain-containing protein [Nostoc sp.]|uniref:ASCH domain-containing protein n=1 Tax=Nostoc sp. TaxID=1180 RepID=UPI002FFC9AD3
MKALSVRQPWAWAIIYALKNIENRGWPIHYRGDILIHTAKTCTQKEYQLAREFCQGMGVVIPELISLRRGQVTKQRQALKKFLAGNAPTPLLIERVMLTPTCRDRENLPNEEFSRAVNCVKLLKMN